MTPRLVLYGRPGCHLCDDARVVLERIGEPFAEIDIESDGALHAAYLERIPVVALDGEELFDFFVDEGALRERLDRVNRRDDRRARSTSDGLGGPAGQPDRRG